MLDALFVANFGPFPATPPHATSRLVGLTRAAGLRTAQLDANLVLWDGLLSSQLATQLAPGGIEGDPLPSALESAKEVWRPGSRLPTPDELRGSVGAFSLMQRRLAERFGALLAPISMFWLETGSAPALIDQILSIAEDPRRNPLIALYEDRILPEIERLEPRLVGIDMFFPGEMIACATLTLLLRRHLPGVHLNFTGQGFDEVCYARLRDDLPGEPRLMLGFDSVFLVRNDAALVDLVRLPEHTPDRLAGIGSLAFRDASGAVRMQGPLVESHLDLDTPADYDGLALGQYLLPRRAIEERVTSRCAWGRCAFCAINAHKGPYRTSSIEALLDRLESSRTTHGTRYVCFLDENLTPDVLECLARGMIERELDLSWFARTRVEKGLSSDVLESLRRAGCRSLWFGLETVSAPLLRLMNKTAAPDLHGGEADRILRECSSLGIGMHFCLLLGFPGETAEHREELVAWFEERKPLLAQRPSYVNVNEFVLNTGSPVERRPAQFGINVLPHDPERFFMVARPFESRGAPLPDRGALDTCRDRIMASVAENDEWRGVWNFCNNSPWELASYEIFADHNPFASADRG